MTGTIQSTKVLLRIRFTTLQLRRSYRKLSMFYKIYKIKVINASWKLIPEKIYTYATRNTDNSPFLTLDTASFQKNKILCHFLLNYYKNFKKKSELINTRAVFNFSQFNLLISLYFGT